MQQREIIKNLNLHNNFHLSLKVIQFVDEVLLKEFQAAIEKQNKTTIVINQLENSFELLTKAYNEKIDVVLCNANIDFLLPLVSVINIDDLSIIKPIVPVYYHLKDNRIAQKVKTKCHKQNIPFESFKTKEELISSLEKII